MSNRNDQITSEIEFSDHSSIKDLTLIKGTFTPSEAQEMLMSLISSKISFHNIKNLRSYEYNGSEEQESKQRIGELEKMREKLLIHLKNADKNGMSVKVESQIKIEFFENSK
ncbi:MAG: hypothetical protein U5K72_16450 [Balneolaceae bacterium]|nr:hypothetical protein [Balneolaceae bacterium]